MRSPCVVFGAVRCIHVRSIPIGNCYDSLSHISGPLSTPSALHAYRFPLARLPVRPFASNALRGTERSGKPSPWRRRRGVPDAFSPWICHLSNCKATASGSPCRSGPFKPAGSYDMLYYLGPLGIGALTQDLPFSAALKSYGLLASAAAP